MTLSDSSTIHVDDLNLKPLLNDRASMAAPIDIEPKEQVQPSSITKHNLAEGQSLEDYLETIEKEILKNALEECRWNKTAAAERLGMSFRSIRYRLKKLGID